MIKVLKDKEKKKMILTLKKKNSYQHEVFDPFFIIYNQWIVCTKMGTMA